MGLIREAWGLEPTVVLGTHGNVFISFKNQRRKLTFMSKMTLYILIYSPSYQCSNIIFIEEGSHKGQSAYSPWKL